MNAGTLKFEDGSFDKVLCIHVMDFLKEHEKVTREILRVLRDEGQFVITYPSGKEGATLGLHLFQETIRHYVDSGQHIALAFSKGLAQMLVGTIYLPLVFRPWQKPRTRNEIKSLMAKFPNTLFWIDEDAQYQDFIVHGTKIVRKDVSRC
jgi:ubiquinone/menaquinone biosynthesis C-methylase UbiE